MARILNTDQMEFAIRAIISKATKRMCIITPYIGLLTSRRQPSAIMERLIDATNRGVHIILITRSFNDEIKEATTQDYKDQLFKQQRKQSEAIDSMKDKIVNWRDYLHIHYCPRLHAKCYFNEADMVLTSLNLTISSVEHENKELGVLLKHGEDEELIKQLQLYINDICTICRPKMCWISANGDFQKSKEQERYGYCIYCGRKIRYHKNDVVCASCKPEIARGYDPPRRFCHLCGEEAYGKDTTRIGHPFHYNCWKSLPN